MLRYSHFQATAQAKLRHFSALPYAAGKKREKKPSMFLKLERALFYFLLCKIILLETSLCIHSVTLFQQNRKPYPVLQLALTNIERIALQTPQPCTELESGAALEGGCIIPRHEAFSFHNTLAVQSSPLWVSAWSIAT